MRILVIIFIFLSVYTRFVSATVSMTMSPPELKALNKLLIHRDLQDIDDFSQVYLRELVEAILIQQAIFQGGFEGQVQLKSINSYEHSLQLVSAGKIAVSGITAWQNDAAELAAYNYVSEALIDKGDYIVGLYTTEEKAQRFSLFSDEQFKQLRPVSTRKWFTDWKTLSAFGYQNILEQYPFTQMVDAIETGLADFTLAPFSNQADLSISTSQERLVPIPNISMKINESRHVLVSKAHPEGLAIFKALNKGLLQFKQQGKIRRALTQSGFYNPELSSWRVLNKVK